MFLKHVPTYLIYVLCASCLVFLYNGKVHSRTGHKGPEGEAEIYSSTFFLISALDGGTLRDRIPVGTRYSARPDRPWGPPSIL